MKFNLLNKIHKRVIFLILLLVIAFFYDYYSIVFFKPQSVHKWRQSDCTSITLNYYQNGMKFFHPEVHALISNGYTTNEAATSEIPLMYYSIAILYKIFGVHEFIYRLINTLIYFFGLFSLFRLMEKLKINFIWSVTLSLLFFASTILVYYGNNFLTDCAAFAFALAGWNYFISYYQQGRMRDFIISMLFFLLGTSMKIFAGISVLALLGIYFLELFKMKFKTGSNLFRKPILQILPFLLIFFIVGAWVLYARNYNIKNQCNYFSTTKIYPYWQLSPGDISHTWEHIRMLWLNHIFHRYTLIIFGLMFVFNLIFIKKANRFLITINIIIFLGVLLYCILFFALFRDHDCYMLNLFILPVFTLLTFAELVNNHYPRFSKNIIVSSLLIFLLIFNVNFTRKEMNARYNGWWTEYPKYRDFYSITPYIRSLGITRFDKVISLPDASHHTLYLMNQPGWTTCFGQNLDSAGIARSIQHGAKYMILASKEELENEPYVKPFIKDTLGRYNKVYIFTLKSDSTGNILP